MLLVRLWLAAELALDAARAMGINYHLGTSRIERFLAPLAGGHLGSRPLTSLGWMELLCAALLALGLLTRIAVLPALLSVLAALASWSRVGSLGTATALDQTSHAIGVALGAVLLVVHGAGRISVDAWLAGSGRAGKRARRRSRARPHS
jgi:uncharacterized membrane protein YphA (DoxX/SURF4 family)